MNPENNGFSLRALWVKYREIILYFIFGFLTFLISVATYTFCSRVLLLNELIANVVSWVIAVLFAFFTNRKWVFDGDDAAKGKLRRSRSETKSRLGLLRLCRQQLGSRQVEVETKFNL